ncbi:nucleotidyltransferase family protein [Rhodococcus qingshengii]|uniref:nucleotidyltransferase family protein n=1 Tax=Rhodococcus qingshengii TaxID=334542 RepID=UPI001A4B73FD|nr:nucleotidyltransferase domain-containing protein [Rhodococcus qingshengii]ULD38895.1 nucleotidyltransferase domain-containing protein [Rhodococcus qingshengii]
MRGVLDAHHSDRQGVARTYNARDLRLFGSVARGDSGPDSDIDILATFGGPSHEQLMSALGIANELTELFGVAVDVIPRGIATDFAPAPVLPIVT